jgi:hypothetical protein
MSSQELVAAPRWFLFGKWANYKHKKEGQQTILWVEEKTARSVAHMSKEKQRFALLPKLTNSLES